MKWISKLAVIALSLGFFSGPLFATGACVDCRVKALGSGPYYDSICTGTSTCIFVAVEGTLTGRPGCSTNQGWHFVFDSSTASGKATYAFLLTAQATGQSIIVGGFDRCNISPSGVVEDLRYVATYAP